MYEEISTRHPLHIFRATARGKKSRFSILISDRPRCRRTIYLFPFQLGARHSGEIGNGFSPAGRHGPCVFFIIVRCARGDKTRLLRPRGPLVCRADPRRRRVFYKTKRMGGEKKKNKTARCVVGYTGPLYPGTARSPLPRYGLGRGFK